MSIISLLRILRRHPLVVGAFALLSLFGLIGIVVTSPPTYRASAAVVLLNPPAVPTATAARPEIPAQFQNPYVRFGDLSVVVDILVRVTASQEVVNSLKTKGLEGTFTIAANRDFYRGPIVDVVAEHTSSASAINDTKLVIKEIQDELVALQTQQGTDPSYFIRAELVVGADRATTVFSGTLRLLIVGAGLGGMITIGAGLLADAIERRRLRASGNRLVDERSEASSNRLVDEPSGDSGQPRESDVDVVAPNRRDRRARETQMPEDQPTDEKPNTAVESARVPARRVAKKTPDAAGSSEPTSPATVRDRAAEVRRRRATDRAESATTDETPPTTDPTTTDETPPTTDPTTTDETPPTTGPTTTKRQPRKRRPPEPKIVNDPITATSTITTP